MNDDADARARIGTVLNDKWTLEKLLGIGGMGAVYAGRHRNGAKAAVKVLHADLARYADVRERFLREGYAANKVEHPGAVKVIDDDLITSGPDAGTAYLVMELLAGESLEDRVERGPKVSEREFLLVADAVLDVLSTAHARGVVHRDLKPENIFLSRDDSSGETRVKVLDFGLARLLDAHTTTMQGVAVGTPSYMSPEQASGRHAELDGRSDLFSLAASGFRLVTGKRIHEGESPVILVTKMANMPAPPIRSVAPDTSIPFARVIDRALAFNREDRYPDAAAMREDVRRALTEMGPIPNPTTLGSAPTIVALPMSLGPLSRRTPEPAIELSGRDLQSLDDGVTARNSDDGRPTKPADHNVLSAIAEEAPTLINPPKVSNPEIGQRAKLESLPNKVAPPPVSSKPSKLPAMRPVANSGNVSRPPPLPSKRPKPGDGAIAPKRKRPSFIPVFTVVVIAGIALKLALDAQPDPRSDVSRDPAPDDSARFVDASGHDTTDASALFASSATIATDTGLPDDAASQDAASQDAAEDDAATGDGDAASDASMLELPNASFETDLELDDAGHPADREGGSAAFPHPLHPRPTTKPHPPGPKTHPVHDPKRRPH